MALADGQVPARAANFVKRPTIVPKEMLMGVIADVPDTIIHLDRTSIIPSQYIEKEVDEYVAASVVAVYYGEQDSVNDQMDRHKRSETVDDNELKTDWRDYDSVGEQYVKSRQKILETPAEFQAMWDGRLS